LRVFLCLTPRTTYHHITDKYHHFCWYPSIRKKPIAI
jgi:hypothetical protein